MPFSIENAMTTPIQGFAGCPRRQKESGRVSVSRLQTQEPVDDLAIWKL